MKKLSEPTDERLLVVGSLSFFRVYGYFRFECRPRQPDGRYDVGCYVIGDKLNLTGEQTIKRPVAVNLRSVALKNRVVKVGGQMLNVNTVSIAESFLAIAH